MGIAVTTRGQDGLSPADLVDVALWHSEGPHTGLSDVIVVHEGVAIHDLPGLIGTETQDLLCSLPLTAPPRLRRQTLSVLSALDGVRSVIAVEEPVAAFANTAFKDTAFKDTAQRTASEMRLIALGGADLCSVVIGDTTSHQIVSIGLVDTVKQIRELMERASRQPGSGEVQVGSSTSDRSLMAIGCELSTEQTEMFTEALGVEIESDRSTHPVLDGLTRLGSLAPWTATWPTTRVHLGAGWTRQPGPLRASVEEHMARLRPDATVRFSNANGEPVPLRAGSVQSLASAIPARLGTQPRMRLIDDGRLLMLGPSGTRPLAMALRWPIPGSGRSHIDVRAASTAGVELIDPEFVSVVASSASLIPENVDQINP